MCLGETLELIRSLSEAGRKLMKIKRLRYGREKAC